MSFVLTRMFAYFTLVSYLVVGTVAVRVLAPEMTTVSFTSSYSNLFINAEIKGEELEAEEAPELAFNEIKFPVEKKEVVKVARPVVVRVYRAPEFKYEKVAPNELPFNEPVKLQSVVFNAELPGNLISLYNDFQHESVVATAPMIEDTVSNKMAATEDVEPEFFEYSEEKVEPAKTADVKTAEVAPEIKEEVQNEVQVEPVVADTKTEVAPEEIAVEDLVSFDYSQAKQDIKEEKVQTISAVTTQASAAISVPAPAVTPIVNKPSHKKVPTQEAPTEKESKSLLAAKSAPKTYSNRMTIQISGTNLKEMKDENGFEVRFQDDLGEAKQDHNVGEISFDQELAESKMTRSVVVLKRGYVPTNSDIILEEGVSEVKLPMIEEGTMNELLAPFESRGPIGAVLVELEDGVEGASLDVPYSQVLKLTEDMEVTEGEDYSYQLFVGVKAGNALLSYKTARENAANKIIHIHEREVTFEANFFEKVKNEKIMLVEEDLLSKEKLPLIISGEEVKQFASDKSAQKVTDHIYKTDFQTTLLGGRKYIELTHQQEPIFVGFRGNRKLEVPSENFMRFVLSKFEDQKLGNRCVVQVNLKKKASRVDVASESVDESLVPYTQILDNDGKFYDSVSSKSRKVIVVGENQGAPGLSQDGKINVKISYEDGSVQYLGTYCSPNTYLVEQL